MFIKKYYRFDNRMQYVIDFSIEKIRSLQLILIWTYGLLAIVAGLDKFTNILVQWEKYLNIPFIESMNIESSYILYPIGVPEILMGILVFLRPKIGAYLIMSWLSLIAIFFFFNGIYMDVAARSLVMAVGAMVLGHLSHLFDTIKINAKASAYQLKPGETSSSSKTLVS